MKKFGIRKTINTGTKTCPGSYMWFSRWEDGYLSTWVRDPAEAKTFSSREDASGYLATNHLSGRIVEIK